MPRSGGPLRCGRRRPVAVAESGRRRWWGWFPRPFVAALADNEKRANVGHRGNPPTSAPAQGQRPRRYGAPRTRVATVFSCCLGGNGEPVSRCGCAGARAFPDRMPPRERNGSPPISCHPDNPRTWARAARPRPERDLDPFLGRDRCSRVASGARREGVRVVIRGGNVGSAQGVWGAPAGAPPAGAQVPLAPRASPACSTYQRYASAMPSRRPILAVQPRLVSSDTSISFRGVPSGLLGSKLNVPS